MILDNYIARRIGAGVAASIAVLLVLVTFVQVVDELGDVGRGNYTTTDALVYVALNIPQTLYELFPMAVLLGSLVGLGALAAGSELTAMRAAGYSVRRIAGATLRAGVLLILLSLLIGEALAPSAQRLAETNRNEKLNENMALRTANGYWARDGQSYINIGNVLPDGSLRDLRIQDYSPSGELSQVTHAAAAAWVNGDWTLFQIRRTRFEQDRVIALSLPSAPWQTRLEPRMMDLVIVRPRMLSTFGLMRYIQFMNDNGQDATIYEVAMWTKLFTPLTILAMILLTIPVVFGSMRNVALGQRIFVGVLIGTGFFLFARLFNNAAVVYKLSPILSAALPSVVVFLLSLWLYRRLV